VSQAPITVINVLPHGPGYELLSEKRSFLHSWTTASGQTAGIVNREWPGELGHWVLQHTDRYRWEVWQPDTHVDRPVAHTFDDGVVHRLFPAYARIFRPGFFRPVGGVASAALATGLEEVQPREAAVVLLHGFGAPFLDDLLDRFGAGFRSLMIAHGTVQAPLRRLLNARHPLTIPAVLVEHARTRRRYARLAAATGPNDITLGAIRSVYSGPTHRLTMGCDFDFWVPPADSQSREATRASLGIAPERTVLIATANLRPVKQIDRLIRACCELGERNDFTLLVVGQGEPEYVRTLESLGAPLLADGRLRVHPYVTGDALRQLLCASDLFVCSSRAEGASVAVMEAMACGLPVLSTPVGGTFEFLKRARAVAVLPAANFQHWPGVLDRVIDGQRPVPVEREMARDEYDWRSVARRVVGILGGVAGTCRR
jgi:glycosyltransferase involved in cell wall biosynthesis